ncbi:hypothetical protein B0H16DRAFT_1473252 [Mycena metata]|uniref:Uncharacterized protein n=1 Tax=Mycena metata TaxID=1033252 RepID=A0AAD7MM90_9AGAR|nr:hypothetical protein B0H16DRAFT_1473252 [Mycena metata]
MRGLRRKANICGAVEDAVLKLSERQVHIVEFRGSGQGSTRLNNSTHGFQHNRLGVASPNARSFAAKETEKFRFTDTTAKGEDEKKSRRHSCPLLDSNQAIMAHCGECRDAALQVCAVRSNSTVLRVTFINSNHALNSRASVSLQGGCRDRVSATAGEAEKKVRRATHVPGWVRTKLRRFSGFAPQCNKALMTGSFAAKG